METTEFRISHLIEKAEEIYKRYGDLRIAVKVDLHTIAQVTEVGVASTSPEITAANGFMCLCPKPTQQILEIREVR